MDEEFILKIFEGGVFPNISCLIIDDSDLTKIPIYSLEFPNLRALFVTRSNGTAYSEVSSLRTETILDVLIFKVSSTLEKLEFYNTKFRYLPRSLIFCKNLTHLKTGFLPQDNFLDPGYIEWSQKLIELNLLGNPITEIPGKIKYFIEEGRINYNSIYTTRRSIEQASNSLSNIQDIQQQRFVLQKINSGKTNILDVGGVFPNVIELALNVLDLNKLCIRTLEFPKLRELLVYKNKKNDPDVISDIDGNMGVLNILLYKVALTLTTLIFQNTLLERIPGALSFCKKLTYLKTGIIENIESFGSTECLRELTNLQHLELSGYIGEYYI
ncbi:hypothetical protein LY90DRAFT_502066 [Neocallimastix californiae]|uniref:L domain-like protein n=1 Tax=Neocallimastix californiae TaxID=1754190 RepID=A0A1Y2EVH9_9FUNG|nr:hypothetical protein LY90DRAFT_502066 [Neocallimastix californiae]|eukprot:ORY75517.1 hypothetical protein LY90DRAFT_502066 [Neocallimastix californiae]